MSRNNRRSVLVLVEHAEGHDPDPDCTACFHADTDWTHEEDASVVSFQAPWSADDEQNHLADLGYFDPPADVRT